MRLTVAWLHGERYRLLMAPPDGSYEWRVPATVLASLSPLKREPVPADAPSSMLKPRLLLSAAMLCTLLLLA